MEAIVFIILQIFYASRAVLKIGEYPRIFPSLSWGIFAHVMCLGQSCERKYLMDLIIPNIVLVKNSQLVVNLIFHYISGLVPSLAGVNCNTPKPLLKLVTHVTYLDA